MNKENKKVKFVFPSIANNKPLMNSCGFEIADPQYEAKMEAVRANRPFIENGKSVEPVKESFAAKACCDNDIIPEELNSACEIASPQIVIKKRGRQPGCKNKPKNITTNE
ncbi:MAG: hypothetical protein ACHQ1D_00185 [Nitrososphaerales archaeon]